MDFLEQVAGLQPLPAGGASAAYSAALGVGLIYKVLSLEMERGETREESQANLLLFRREIERLYGELKVLISRDSECYVNFNENIRSGDAQAGKAAFLETLTCSMQVMEKAYDGLEWARTISKISSFKLHPNLRVAAELLAAGLSGTAHVVRENIGRIKSPEKQQSYVEKVDSLHEQGMRKKDEVLHDI